MTTLTIPKEITGGERLVVMPQREFEALLNTRIIPEVAMTVSEKRALKRARENFKKGKFMTIDELRQKLGFGNK